MGAKEKNPHHVNVHAGDWMRDPAIRTVPPEDRGIIMDLWCLSKGCDQPGHLEIAGRAITDAELARICGTSEQKFRVSAKRMTAKRILRRAGKTLVLELAVKDAAARATAAKHGTKGQITKLENALQEAATEEERSSIEKSLREMGWRKKKAKDAPATAAPAAGAKKKSAKTRGLVEGGGKPAPPANGEKTPDGRIWYGGEALWRNQLMDLLKEARARLAAVKSDLRTASGDPHELKAERGLLTGRIEDLEATLGIRARRKPAPKTEHNIHCAF